jgi:hypothetical protein
MKAGRGPGLINYLFLNKAELTCLLHLWFTEGK